MRHKTNKYFILVSAVVMLLCLSNCNRQDSANKHTTTPSITEKPNIERDSTVSSIIEKYEQSKWMFDSLTLYQKNNDRLNTIRIEILLADNFRASGNYNDALNYYKKAHNDLYQFYGASTSFEIEELRANIYNGKSSVYFELYYHHPQQSYFLDSSISIANKALDIGKFINNPRTLWSTMNLLGACQIQLENYMDAKIMLEEADSLHALVSDQPSLAVLANLSYVHMMLGNYEIATNYCNNCYQAALENKNHSFIGTCLKNKAELCRIQGDTTTALECEQKLDVLRLQKDNLVKSLVTKQLLYEYEQEQSNSKVLGLYKEQYYLFRLSRLLSITLGVFFLVVLSIGLLIRRNLRKKREIIQQKLKIKKQESQLYKDKLKILDQEMKLEAEKAEKYYIALQKKEQELLFQSVRQVRLKRLNQSIQTKLGPFINQLSRKKDQQAFKESIQSLIEEANSEPFADFEELFLQMYDGFYKKLLDLNPDFTRSELQLCALLRLNLSTKEMADLLALSPTTIDQRRYNIRQKLKLSSSDSLNSYLIKL